MSGRTAGKLIRAQKVRYTEDKIYSENIVSYHTDAIKSDYAYFSHNISILGVKPHFKISVEAHRRIG